MHKTGNAILPADIDQRLDRRDVYFLEIGLGFVDFQVRAREVKHDVSPWNDGFQQSRISNISDHRRALLVFFLVLETIEKARENPIEARRLQKRLSALSADIEAHGIPGVKAATKAAGLDPGYPREPLTRVSRGVETSIAKQIP